MKVNECMLGLRPPYVLRVTYFQLGESIPSTVCFGVKSKEEKSQCLCVLYSNQIHNLPVLFVTAH